MKEKDRRSPSFSAKCSKLLHFVSMLSFCSLCRGQESSLMKFATQPTHQTAVLGSTVVLPCRVINRQGTVQWTRDGFGLGTVRRLKGFDRYSMIGSDEEGDFSLQISPVALEDDSEYQCQVASKRGPKLRSRVARLTVFVPPRRPVITPFPTVSATAGVNVTINCQSVGGRPAPEIQWLDDSAGLEIREGIVYSEHVMQDGLRVNAESILTFTPTRHHHSRTLTCLTHNPALNEPLASRVNLMVQFPPEIELKISPAELSEGTNTEVLCQAEANPTRVKYKWLRRGKEVPGADGPKLNLGVLTRSDHGSLIACEATNAVGTIRRTQRLNVKYAPRFETAPGSESAEPDEEVTLRCKVDSNPLAEITWQHLETESIVGKGAELTLTASRTTAGTYICIVISRGYKRLEGEVHLRLRGPPIISASTSVATSSGEPVELRCKAVAIPHPLAVTWSKEGITINPGSDKRIAILEKQLADGILSSLRINSTEETDFAAYNCSVLNEYGIDNRQIILRKQTVIPVLFIVGAGMAVIIFVVIVIIMILCRCGRKPKLPDETKKSAECGQTNTELASHVSIGSLTSKQENHSDVIKSNGAVIPTILNTDVTSLTNIRPNTEIRHSDNDSDTKDIDNRTSSSLSAADRDLEHWDGSDQSAIHHPLQYPRYNQSTIYGQQEQRYLSYADYSREYAPVLVGGESYAQFKLGGPYARSSPASDPPSSLSSSVAPPPYTPTPNGVVGVNGLTSRTTPQGALNGRVPNGVTVTNRVRNNSGGVSTPTLRHDLLSDIRQSDLDKEANSNGRMEANSQDRLRTEPSSLHSKFILPPQANMKPGTLV